MKIHAFAILILFFLCGCSENKESEKKASSTNENLTAPYDEDLLSELLKERYKKKHKSYDCYILEEKEEKFCVNIEIIFTQETNQGKNLYVVESGMPMGDNGILFDSHANHGVITLFLINRNGDEMKILAQSQAISNGPWGKPNPVKIYRPGSRETRGWILSDGDMHQGYAGGTISLYLQQNNRIVHAATIGTYYDNSGACWSDDECSSTALSTGVETIPSNNAEYYDLKIKTKGEKKEKGKVEIPIEKEFIIKFDKLKFEYQIEMANKLYDGLDY